MADERAYQDWLWREEDWGLDSASLADIDSLRTYMSLRAEERGEMDPSGAQVDSLWGAVQAKFDFESEGFRVKRGKFIVEPRVRFYIKGRRGGFGRTRAREIWQEQFGEAAPF